MKLTFTPLAPLHQRKDFSCGEAKLDEYIRLRASQDARHGYASVIIASPVESPDKIAGFYTLSSASVNLGRLPESEAKKLPRYPEIPAIRLGRLAVHMAFQGIGLGRILVLDAIRRCCRSEIAWALLLVDAKNERVQNFYTKMYFSFFHDNHLYMWMKRKQAEKLAALI